MVNRTSGFKRLGIVAGIATMFLFVSFLPSQNYQGIRMAHLILDLVLQVEDMNLQSGISNSLDAKLQSALDALDDINSNNDVAAINSLEAFVNAVEAQRGKKISNEIADSLIDDADFIIVYLDHYIHYGVCPICGGTCCIPPCPYAQ